MLERAAALGIVFSLGLVATHAWPVTLSNQTSAHTRKRIEISNLGQITGLFSIPARAQAETDFNPEDAPTAFYLRVVAPVDTQKAPPSPGGAVPAHSDTDDPTTTSQELIPSPETDIATADQASSGEDATTGSEREAASEADAPGPSQGVTGEDAPADASQAADSEDAATNSAATATEEEPSGQAEPPAPEPAREVSDRSGATDDAVPVRLKQSKEIYGIATYYHPSLEGRRMANGRPYVSSAMTAASNRWPLGTKLRVTYNASVVVEITDRGNFSHALDLSAGAFRAIAGSLTPGVIQVTIEELEDDP